MAARESVQFDFLSRGADGLARDFTKTGEGATVAAKGARLLADSLEKQRKATDVAAGASLALAKADKILADAEDEAIAKFVEARIALDRQKAAMKDTAAETGGLSARIAALTGGSGGVGGMGALAAAGIGLAPILATVGAGLAGDAAAAAGIVGPVIKATQSAGGLQKAWAKLDPAQRAAAGSLLVLKGEYHTFQDSLKPEILSAFAGATRLAGHVMADVQPIAAITGKSFGGLIDQIDSTLQDGQWQQFWAFMGRTAPGDMQLLDHTVVTLTNDLPSLLESLQPVGHGILVVADDAAKAAGGITRFYQSFQKNVPVSTEHTFGFLRDLDKWTVSLTNHIPGFSHVNNVLSGVQRGILGAGTASGKSAPQVGQLGSAASTAAPQVKTLAVDMQAVNTAADKGLSPLLAYSGALLATRDDAKKFADAMKASHNEIGLNTQKQRDSFGAANTYIQDLITQAQKAHDAGKGTGAEIGMLEQALPALDRAKTHSKLYWQEVQTLKNWLDKLRAEKAIREVVIVSGSGSWTMHNPANQSLPGGFPGGTGAAAGMLVRGGIPGRDSVLINAMPGELVVPTKFVASGAVDHLRGQIPGFAAGGIVPSYGGDVAGLKPWAAGNVTATNSAVLNALGNAIAHGVLQSLAGLGAGSSGPLQSIAKQMLGQLGWGSQWPQFNALEMREAGWNPSAANPSSGAYGLPQALPPGKMASAGADWRTNPVTQLRWMMGYIGARYGSPAGAWAHETSFGWYRNGLDAVVRRPTVIGVGEAGPERVTVTPLGHGAAQEVHIHVHVDPAVAAMTPDRRLGRAIAEHVLRHTSSGGRLYPVGVAPK